MLVVILVILALVIIWPAVAVSKLLFILVVALLIAALFAGRGL
jgi:hypothetical protein